MRSPNHSPQPGKFRRKAAAWTAGLALVGGAAAELSSAAPAHGGTEVALTSESMNPKQYVTKLVETDLPALYEAIASAKKGVQPEKEGPTMGYALVAPDLHNPKAVDEMVISTRPGGGIEGVMITENIKAKDIITGNSKAKGVRTGTLAVWGKSPTMVMLTGNMLRQNVGVGDSADAPVFQKYVNYSAGAAEAKEVRAAFDAYFKTAYSILARHYSDPGAALEKILKQHP